MIKHKYNVFGIHCEGSSLFTGICIADDIIKAIELFREKNCSVWNIERKEQIQADVENQILSVNILGDYDCRNFDSKIKKHTYSLYKRIMKHNPKAIDDIMTLEQAKEIIKMMAGNVYLNGELYHLQQEYIDTRMSKECGKDCLFCANSTSEPCDNGDILHGIGW